MNISFDSIFFLLFGIISLVAALKKKNILFWTSINYDGLRNFPGNNYSIIINIICGIVSLFVALYLLLN
jgi:uncharacterized membrane protein